MSYIPVKKMNHKKITKNKHKSKDNYSGYLKNIEITGFCGVKKINKTKVMWYSNQQNSNSKNSKTNKNISGGKKEIYKMYKLPGCTSVHTSVYNVFIIVNRFYSHLYKYLSGKTVLGFRRSPVCTSSLFRPRRADPKKDKTC